MNEQQQLAAVKQALEALRFALHVGFDESSERQIKKGGKAVQQHQQAITTLQSIISQDALDKMAENARELGLSYDDAIKGGVGIMLGGKRIDPASIYKDAPPKQDVPETNFGNMAEPKIGCVNHDCDKCKAVQEPVAWVDWLPEGTTHIAKCTVTTSSGGSLSLRTHAFKYEADVLKVYTTDNDNEYPGWIDAKDAFYHLNFAIVPLYTAPQPVPVKTYHDGKPWPVAPKPWVGLTDEEIDEHLSEDAQGDCEMHEYARAIEAKLKAKNERKEKNT
jgi:hypothetical protein